MRRKEADESIHKHKILATDLFYVNNSVKKTVEFYHNDGYKEFGLTEKISDTKQFLSKLFSIRDVLLRRSRMKLFHLVSTAS